LPFEVHVAASIIQNDWRLYGAGLPPQGWDYWVMGTSKSVQILGQTINFANDAGIIMATLKNRKTQFFSMQTDDMEFNHEDEILDFEWEFSFENTWDKYNPEEFNNWSITNNKLRLKSLKVMKSGWVQDVSQCSKLEMNSFTSKCYYFDIFDTPGRKALDFMNGAAKNIPQTKNSCDQTQVLSFNRYGSQTSG
jgi:hypothetical protein